MKRTFRTARLLIVLAIVGYGGQAVVRGVDTSAEEAQARADRILSPSSPEGPIDATQTRAAVPAPDVVLPVIASAPLDTTGMDCQLESSIIARDVVSFGAVHGADPAGLAEVDAWSELPAGFEQWEILWTSDTEFYVVPVAGSLCDRFVSHPGR